VTIADSPTTYEVVHPACAGRHPMTPDVLWSIPRVGTPVPSRDGRHAVVPVTTYDGDHDGGLTRLWLVTAEGGPPRPLTATNRNASDPAFSPDGVRLAFVAADLPAPGEAAPPSQVYVLPLDGGEAERVTDLPLGVFGPRWLPDGRGLVFGAWLFRDFLSVRATRLERDRRRTRPVTAHVTEERFFRYWDAWLVDGKVPHLFRLDLESGDVHDLMRHSDMWFDWMDLSNAFDVSPDGTEIVMEAIACRGREGRPRSDVYRLPIEGGEPECLTAANPADSSAPRYAPDGATVIYGRREDPDFYADRVRLMRYHRASRRDEPALDHWDLSPVQWRFGWDGWLWFHAEDEGRTRLFSLSADAAAGASPSPHTDVGSCSHPAPTSSGLVFFLRQGLSEPPEVYVLAPELRAPTRLTSFTDGAMEDVALGEVRSVRFAGAEDEQVQMYVVLPPDHQEGERRPLVHMIHGGPHGMFGDAWSWRWHAHTFAARGWVCALVNFQGSTSWGQDFAQRIQGAWGDRPYHDVMRATDLLVASGLADEDHMAISGGSYGGYLVSWIASRTNRFRCAVNHAGVYDLTVQFATDHTWGWHREMGGTPWDGHDRMDRWDPARHAAGLNTPMLVILGPGPALLRDPQGEGRSGPAALVPGREPLDPPAPPFPPLVLGGARVVRALVRAGDRVTGSGRLRAARRPSPSPARASRLRAGAALLLGLAAGACGGTSRASRTLEIRLPAPADAAFHVETRNGAVEARRRDDLGEVVLRARLLCAGRTFEEAEARARDAALDVLRDEHGVVHVRPRFPGGARAGDGARIALEAPAPRALTVRTESGPVLVAGLRGPLRIEASNAGVEVMDHEGAVDVTASRGRVLVHNVAGPLRVRAEDADVTGEHVDGPADVRTTNAAVHVALSGRAQGPIDLRTTNAPIEVWVGAAFRGPVRLASAAGVRIDDPANRVTHTDLSPGGGIVTVGEGGAPSAVATTGGRTDFHVGR
jgi:dipeptidyl aminopeptidase/acylaminoacyl peptidase